MTTFRRLFSYVRPYWRSVAVLTVVIVAFASVSGVSLTLIPSFLKILVTPGHIEVASVESRLAPGEGVPLPHPIAELKAHVLFRAERFLYAGSSADRLRRFCVLLILLMLIKNLLHYAQTAMTERLEQRVLYCIRRDVFRHLQRVPLAFFHVAKAGHIISRMTNDVTLLHGVVIGVGASVIRNLLLAVVAIGIILAVSWKLTLVTFIVLPINAWIVGAIGQRLRRRTHRAQEGMADMVATLEESVSGARVVRAFDRGDAEERRFDQANLRHTVQNVKLKLLGALSSPVSEVLGTLSFVVILWFGGRLVISGAVGVESLVLFIGAMLFLITPVKELSKLNNHVQQSIAAGERVFSVLGQEAEAVDVPGRDARFEESLDFDNVTFAYRSGQPVLRHVTFRARPGEVIAIVGPSGAGKTTLVDLVPRFYEPSDGRVLLDGVDTRALSLRSLRSLMGIVTQDTVLFNDSIRANISYGVDVSTDEAIEAAARAANAHSFITAMPDGYDTMVGDRGVQLSGGQRQRIAIARALLRDPEILIFDEATSALDTESELLVQEAIDRLLKGRTTFVIAHRLSTVTHADRILVLENGVLRETGTHDELMRESGVYRRLYDLQFGMVG